MFLFPGHEREQRIIKLKILQLSLHTLMNPTYQPHQIKSKQIKIHITIIFLCVGNIRSLNDYRSLIVIIYCQNHLLLFHIELEQFQRSLSEISHSHYHYITIYTLDQAVSCLPCYSELTDNTYLFSNRLDRIWTWNLIRCQTRTTTAIWSR